jgi:transposase
LICLEYDKYYYTTGYKVLSEDEEEEKEPLRALFSEIRNFSYFNLNSLNLYDFNLYKDKTPIFTLDIDITNQYKSYVFKGNNNVEIRAWKHKDGKQNDLVIRYYCALDLHNRDKPVFKGEGYRTMCVFVNRIFNAESDLTEQSKVSLETGDIIPFGDTRIKFNQKQLTNYYKSKGFVEEGLRWLSKPITQF